MSDLIEQLRNWDGYKEPPVNEAADEIERLRAENKRLRNLVAIGVDPTGMDDADVEFVLSCVETLEDSDE